MNDVYQNEYLLVRKVKEGLDKNAFYVQYQPIVKSDGSEVVSFEALIRWDDEELGAVSPLQFIPLAESSGLILPIGELVCQKVMEFYMELKKYGYDKIKLSINVSIVQFYQKQFVENLVKLTKECGIDPKYIQLEITESVMIETYDYIVEKLNELKKHGFHIALDDFGTGFSSLAYLQKLPIDVIKIDKTFIDQIYDLRGATLVDATISIANRFGITTIAEGVETKEQVDYLVDKKCDLIQGFYYSKALMAKDAIQFVIDRNQR
jgi:EAL domain-containing protein (putative c-di-GMP-specific phosphodiesterase class I)